MTTYRRVEDGFALDSKVTTHCRVEDGFALDDEGRAKEKQVGQVILAMFFVKAGNK